MNTKLKVYTKSGVKDVSVQFSEFPDKDSYCLIEQTAGIKGNHVLISHDLYPEQNQQIIKLLLLMDLLQDLEAKSVSLLVPYLPYARQDKRHIAGEAISADMLSKLLKRSGLTTLYTFDCHFMKGAPVMMHFGLKIVNITLGPYLLDYFNTSMEGEPYEVIGPDKGSSYFVQEHGSQNMNKERGDYDEGLTKHRSVSKLEHEHLKLSCNNVAIIDDMISTGGTLLKAVNNLHDHGIENVYCIAVHGLFLNGCYEKLQKHTEGVIVSDTLKHESSVFVTKKAYVEQIEPAWLNYCSSNKV